MTRNLLPSQTRGRPSRALGPVAGLAVSAGVTAIAYPLVFLPATVALLLAWFIGTIVGTRVGGTGRLVIVSALVPPALAAPAFMPVLDLTQILILGVAALGLNVVVGWTGQLSLAQGTVAGLGAYVSAILAADHGWPLLLTIPFAAAFCGVVGLLLGALALRFEGVFLAILTMCFALVVPIVLKRSDGLTGGTQGIIVPQVSLPGGRETGEYFLTLACVVIVVALTHNVVRGTIGLAFHAVRESPIAAQGSGIDTSRIRIAAFVLGSVLAGVAGSLYTVTVGFVSPDAFGLFYGIQLLTMVVAGGVRSLSGAFIGAWLIFQLNTHAGVIELGALVGADHLALSPQAVFALILITVLIAAPGGLVGTVSQLSRAVMHRQRRAMSRRLATSPAQPTPTEGMS